VESTRIALFTAEPSVVARGAAVEFRWVALEAATVQGAPSCSISRIFAGGEPQPAETVPCEGTLREVPVAPMDADAVNYQLNVLKRPYVPGATDPYLTKVVTVYFADDVSDDEGTSIVRFDAAPLNLGANEPVTLTWEARNAAPVGTAPACSITRRFEGAEAQSPFAVACQGSLQEVPSGPAGAAYVRYQFNVLKDPFDEGDPYLTAVVSVGLQAGTDSVTVGVEPSSATLGVNATQVFTANVTGAGDASVTWSATCGAVTGSGATITYTAPPTAGDCVVTATSVADPSAHASVTVAVVAATGPEWRVEPSTLHFYSAVGEGAPAAQPFVLHNDGAEPGTFALSGASTSLVSASPETGTVPAGGSTAIGVSVSSCATDDGTVTTQVGVSGGGNAATLGVSRTCGQPATGTGMIQVSITGLPSGTLADVRMQGGGWTLWLTQSALLPDMPAATYQMAAFDIQVSGTTYEPVPVSASYSVTAGSTTTVEVVYVPVE